MKFVLMACGINRANGEYTYVWCKCTSHQRFDITKSWSVTDSEKGARTISVIKEMASKKQCGSEYSCVHFVWSLICAKNPTVVYSIHSLQFSCCNKFSSLNSFLAFSVCNVVLGIQPLQFSSCNSVLGI